MFGGMGNMGNMAQMMKKVQKAQAQMKLMQEEIKKKTVEVTVGGGAVKMAMNGDHVVQSLYIDKSAVDPEDIEMLQDLVMSAMNEVIKKTDDMMNNEMQKLMSNLGLPAGMMG